MVKVPTWRLPPTPSMTQVLLDKARPGMVLTSPVVDRRGRLLIPSGRELEARHVQALRMWGIETVDVAGDGVETESAPALPPELLARAQAEVEALFRNAGGGHPFLAGLIRAAAERRALAWSRGEEP